MDRRGQGRGKRRSVFGIVLLAGLMVASVAMAVPASGVDSTTGIGPAEVEAKPGDRTAAPVVLFEPTAEGVEVVVATGAEANVVARLAVPGVETRLWTGYGCVTGSGGRVGVVFAPVEIVNDPAMTDRGAFFAVVDLDGPEVVVVEELVALKYHSPGCGPTDEVAAVRYIEDGWTTEVVSVRGDGAGLAASVDRAEGRLTFPAPSDDAVFLSSADSIVALADGQIDVVDAVEGSEIVDLHASPGGGVDFLAVNPSGRAEALSLDRRGSEPQRLAVGRVGELAWANGAGGDNLLLVSGEDVALDGAATAVVVDERPDGVSLDGETVASSDVASSPDQATGGDAVVVEVDGLSSPIVLDRGGPAVATVAGQVTAVAGPNEQVCAVAVNDPEIQVIQPSPAQVEWAAHLVVRGELEVVRPANWNNNGLGPYSPQATFGIEALDTGGRVPAQVLMGVLAQESNFWQASRRALPGMPGNPLVGNYFGAEFESGRVVAVDPSEADCGYGIGQVTDGMRLDETGQAFRSAAQQKMIATDYLANMVEAHNILARKWNELAEAGLITAEMDPALAENWYFPLWAYNTGYHSSHPSGRTGLGWTNNPANSDYRFDRRYFQRAGLDDARTPADWPYQERVLGFVEHGLYLRGDRAFTPGSGLLDLPAEGADDTMSPAVKYRLPVDRFRLCTTHNLCSRNHVDPPGGPVRGDKSFCMDPDRRCWWDQPAPFLPPHGEGVIESTLQYQPDSPEPSVSNPYPAACDRNDAEMPPFGPVESIPAGAIIVDDVPPGTDNLTGCGAVAADGRFDIDFASPVAEVDFSQFGTGYGGHFWNSGTNWDNRPTHTITGTWTPPTGTTGWHRILVHIPTVGADTYQADYQIFRGDEAPGADATYHRVVNQRWNQNQWIDLGLFPLQAGARVELSNVTYSDHGKATAELVGGDPYYSDGKFISIAWDAVAFVPEAPPEVAYVAIGDGYASGEGLGGYTRPTDIGETTSNEENRCHRAVTDTYAERAYRATVDSNPGWTTSFGTTACSGATSAGSSVGPLTSWGEVPQLRQGWLDATTTHVTIHAGAGDIRLLQILELCNGDGDCRDQPLNGGEAVLRQRLPADVDATFLAMRDLVDTARELAPNAEILLIGYPRLPLPTTPFEVNPKCNRLTTMSDEERAWMRSNLDVLHRGLSVVAAERPDVMFLDLADRIDRRGECDRPFFADPSVTESGLLNEQGHTILVEEISSFLSGDLLGPAAVRNDLEDRIAARLSGNPDVSDQDIARMAKTCGEFGYARGSIPSTCLEQPLYFLSEVDIPTPVQLRVEAIGVHPDWHFQRRQRPPNSRSWLRRGGVVNIDWPDGVTPETRRGCLQPRPTQMTRPQCDEFPNAAFQAGGGDSTPRPAVRWMPGSENGREGSRLRTFFRRCGIDDGDSFLVIPLLIDEQTNFVPPDRSFEVC